jgi:hypothetical protein
MAERWPKTTEAAPLRLWRFGNFQNARALD